MGQQFIIMEIPADAILHGYHQHDHLLHFTSIKAMWTAPDGDEDHSLYIHTTRPRNARFAIAIMARVAQYIFNRNLIVQINMYIYIYQSPHEHREIYLPRWWHSILDSDGNPRKCAFFVPTKLLAVRFINGLTRLETHVGCFLHRSPSSRYDCAMFHLKFSIIHSCAYVWI